MTYRSRFKATSVALALSSIGLGVAAQNVPPIRSKPGGASAAGSPLKLPGKKGPATATGAARTHDKPPPGATGALPNNMVSIAKVASVSCKAKSMGHRIKTTPVHFRSAPAPNVGRFVTRLYRLKYVSAEEASQLLTKFKSKEGDLSICSPGRLLIITDTGVQVRRMIQLVEGNRSGVGRLDTAVSRKRSRLLHYFNRLSIFAKMGDWDAGERSAGRPYPAARG